MVVNRGKQYSDVEQIPKSHLRSDCRLQLACKKLRPGDKFEFMGQTYLISIHESN